MNGAPDPVPAEAVAAMREVLLRGGSALEALEAAAPLIVAPAEKALRDIIADRDRTIEQLRDRLMALELTP